MKTYCSIKILFLLCAASVLLACEDNSLEQTSLITVQAEVTTRVTSVQDEGVTNSVSPVVFTGNDISWFDTKTGEIKFAKSFNPYDLAVFQKLNFYLDGKLLFTVNTYVQPIHSFASNDLVLYLEADDKCYLHDCYPLSIIDTDPTVKVNKEKRSESWNKFVNQLKNERKIKR